MRCPACAFENPAGVRFCGNCAHPLERPCSRCGFENPPGFKFCGRCAAPLRPGADARRAPSDRDRRAYTPNHLAEKILVSRSAIEGERKQVTVLFADVERSMELAEQVDAEEWHRILDRFFAILAEGIHRFEGTINQFTGDGIMALFGAPLAHEDHARRACHAALHLGGSLGRYGEELKRTLGLGFSVRIGLNSGEVVVGKIGDDLRMDYTAQGHTVGLAARMQQLAGPDRTYLTEHTAALVSGYFTLRDLGRFELKGVRSPVRVYELEGVGPLRTRLDASRARGLSRFVGRAEETQVLEDALARAVAGGGGVVGIAGEAGVGKSRLGYEFAERCRARGVRLAEAHAPPHGRMVPLLPWVELYRGLFGIAREDADETARDKVAGRMLRLDEGLTESLPVLLDLLGIPDPARPPPAMEPEARQRRLVEIVQRLARAEGRRGPAVLLFEDLHWMDGLSEGLLAALMEVLSETRTLVIATFRPGYRFSWMERPEYRQIALQPLGPAAITELLDVVLGDDTSLAGLAERIRERTGGNPFFIEEVVQSLVESGLLAGTRGSLRLTRPVEKLDIPASVQSILAARIDRLAEDERAVLDVAAVTGATFSEPVLERVTGMSGEELRSALAGLVAGELVYPQAPAPIAEYAFKHPLTQEVAYRSQLAERRAATHERVARAIVEIDAGRLGERAALLAHHFEAAGKALEAARWSRRAARRAASSDLAEALAYWRKAAALLAGLPESAETRPLALEARAAILYYGWIVGISADEAGSLFAEGRELAARAGDSRALAILTAHYAAVNAAHRDVDEYLRLSNEAARIAEETGDAALRAAMWTPLVRAHLLAGRLREALPIVERALAAVPEDPAFGTLLGYSPYLNLLELRGNLVAYAGRWSEAVVEFERMIAVAREHGHHVLAASGCSDYAWWAALFGDCSSALTNARRSLETAEKLGSQMTRVYAYNALGVAELCAGRFAEAASALDEALRIARERRTSEERGVLILAHLAEAHLGRGELARARDLAEESVREACRGRVPAAECFARLAEARARVAAGTPEERAAAASALERALALVEETGAACYEPFVRTELARLARRSGDEASHRREIDTARRLFVAMGASVRAKRLDAE